MAARQLMPLACDSRPARCVCCGVALSRRRRSGKLVRNEEESSASLNLLIWSSTLIYPLCITPLVKVRSAAVFSILCAALVHQILVASYLTSVTLTESWISLLNNCPIRLVSLTLLCFSQLEMEDQGGSRACGKKVAFLLAGTAAVALAAAYYSKRHSTMKRPANNQESIKLRRLLQQVWHQYLDFMTLQTVCTCVLLYASCMHIGMHKCLGMSEQAITALCHAVPQQS